MAAETPLGKRKQSFPDPAAQEKIEQARTERRSSRERSGARAAAELRYGLIPQLQRDLDEQKLKLAELQKRTGRCCARRSARKKIAASSPSGRVPLSKLLECEADKLVHLEEQLHRSVVGQDEAVKAAAAAVRRARAGLKDPSRPVGTFIFLGPTGVGKTELARALAETLFDDERALIRLDMSEYSERHAVARMIGAPPGYVGYEEGGQLTEAVLRRPLHGVLLDDIEKSTPMSQILLQVPMTAA